MQRSSGSTIILLFVNEIVEEILVSFSAREVGSGRVKFSSRE